MTMGLYSPFNQLMRSNDPFDADPFSSLTTTPSFWDWGNDIPGPRRMRRHLRNQLPKLDLIDNAVRFISFVLSFSIFFSNPTSAFFNLIHM